MKSINDAVADDYSEYWRSDKDGEPLGVVLVGLLGAISIGAPQEEEPMGAEGKVLAMFAQMYKAAWEAGFTARLSGVKGDDDGLSK
jgi:hypothetical protein